MAERGGRRVLVSGMGGDLGSRVAVHLERQAWVGQLLGIDTDPPRRRLKRAEFHLASPHDHDRILSLFNRFNPHVIVHLSVWEPFSRANPKTAKTLTAEASISTLGAAAESRALESIVVRSGIEVYGRSRGAPTRPDESAALAPTCEFGRSLADIESTARDIGRRIGVPVAAVRLGSVLGPHVPSPLGRLLAHALRAVQRARRSAVRRRRGRRLRHGVRRRRRDAGSTSRSTCWPTGRSRRCRRSVGEGASRYRSSARIGGLAKVVSGLAGAPIPDHVLETLHRGRLADNGRMRELVGFSAALTTVEVIDKLYAWPSVIRQPAARQVA